MSTEPLNLLRMAPSQPSAPLTDAELATCASIIKASNWRADGGGPIVLSYATQISEKWLLGLSAAMHGSPIVLAGLGRRGWQWWEGGGGKLKGTARALQLLHSIDPDAPIVFGDGGDTVVVNHWSRAAALRHIAEHSLDNGVLTGGECNSWPLCYAKTYLRDHRYRRCLSTHATCFPNSGTYLGRAKPLHGFVDGLMGAMSRLNARGYPGQLAAEKGDDQAALHHLYLNARGYYSEPDINLTETVRQQMWRARGSKGGGSSSSSAMPPPPPPPPPAPPLSVRIDGGSSFFLNLWICSGITYRLRGRGPFEYCHQRPFDAMPRIRMRANGTALQFLPENRTNGHEAAHKRPFLVHSNGRHYRLQDPALAPIMRRLKSPPTEEEKARLLQTPVLLLDSVAFGTCGVASLDRVLRGWEQHTVAPV